MPQLPKLRRDVLRRYASIQPILSLAELTRKQQAALNSYYRKLQQLDAAYRQQAATRSEQA